MYELTFSCHEILYEFGSLNLIRYNSIGLNDRFGIDCTLRLLSTYQLDDCLAPRQYLAKNKIGHIKGLRHTKKMDAHGRINGNALLLR